MSAILLKNLDISYGTTKVVQDANIEVAEGESFALVGESGSGKSTILKAIAGLAPDDPETARIAGHLRSKAADWIEGPHGHAIKRTVRFVEVTDSPHGIFGSCA